MTYIIHGMVLQTKFGMIYAGRHRIGIYVREAPHRWTAKIGNGYAQGDRLGAAVTIAIDEAYKCATRPS